MGIGKVVQLISHDSIYNKMGGRFYVFTYHIYNLKSFVIIRLYISGL